MVVFFIVIMKYSLKIIILPIFFCTFLSSVMAQENLGKKVSQICVTCHGANGLSTMPEAPNLAGQPEIYLIEQLKNYQSGKRKHEVMSVVAKQLSEPEIDAIARFYSSFIIQVK